MTQEQRPLIGVFIITILLQMIFCPGESESFDRIGIISEHGAYGSSQTENIDLYNGNLTLRYLDLSLPGANGLNLNIWRVYNSKLYKDRATHQTGHVLRQDPYSWLGWGWSLHMGYVEIPEDLVTSTGSRALPVTIHFPDGRMELAYPSANTNFDETQFRTKGFMTYNRARHELYFQDGTVWCFNQVAPPVTSGGPERRYVTSIHNCFDDEITISFFPDWPSIPQTITDSFGRVVTFQISLCGTNHPYHNPPEGNTPLLTAILVKNSDGETVTYQYDVTDIGASHQLRSFQPPLLPPTTYTYNGQHELSQVNLPSGGTIAYEYDDHFFWSSSTNIPTAGYFTRVLSKKTECPGSWDPASPSWTYTYPDNNLYLDDSGITTVEGPFHTIQATFFAVGNDTEGDGYWKRGLLKQTDILESGSLISRETKEWDCVQITTYYDTYPGNPDGRGTFAPLFKSSYHQARGDASSKQVFSYATAGAWSPGKFGLPGKIEQYVSGTLVNTTYLNYFYEDNDLFRDHYLLQPIKLESIYDSNEQPVTRVKNDYYLCGFPGMQGCWLGALKTVRRWENASVFRQWDYAYSRQFETDGRMKSVTVAITLPGGGVETRVFTYGTESASISPTGVTLFSRVISPHTGCPLSETNRDGGTVSFAYDDLNRVTTIVFPEGFNPLSVTWTAHQVSFSRGSYTRTKYWDGLGRETGYDESDTMKNGGTEGGITLHYRRQLDAEGRMVAENKGSTDPCNKYTFSYDALGRLLTATDPLGTVMTLRTYEDGGVQKVTDARGNQTEFKFEVWPGKYSSLKDPAGNPATLAYDALGRLTAFHYSPTSDTTAHDDHTFSYNWLGDLKTESHPETGTITYTYTLDGLLELKEWGGMLVSHTYNLAGQIQSTSAGEEKTDYTYFQFSGRLHTVTGYRNNVQCWKREITGYDSLGNIQGEIQTLPGLAIPLTLDYQYDPNGFLKQIRYPSGRTVNYENNGAGLPSAVSGSLALGEITYGAGWNPLSMIFGPASAVTQSQVFDSSDRLTSSGCRKSGGAADFYHAEYGYDLTGNITGVNNTTPPLDAIFTYDNLNRLTGAIYSGDEPATYQYSYDVYGNMTSARKNSTPARSFEYTKQNRLLGPEYLYDSRGNLLQYPHGGQLLTNTWDPQNRLLQTAGPDGTALARYQYDDRGLRLCSSVPPPAASAPLSFSQVTAQPVATDPGDAQAVCWGDFDNDGLEDLFISHFGQTYDNVLYRNRGDGTFTRLALGDKTEKNSMGACWGDYNNDGHLDLFVVNYVSSGTHVNHLYRNNGDGTLSRVTGLVFDTEKGEFRSASWIDYDRDGWLDLYVSNYSTWGKDILYHNEGGGSFTRDLEALPPNTRSMMSYWCDYDSDNLPDVLLVEPAGNRHLLYHNDGGVFSLVNDTPFYLQDYTRNTRSASWGDSNNDGYMDLFFANWAAGGLAGNNILFSNIPRTGDPEARNFLAIKQGAVYTDTDESSGSAWADFDNDGDLDLLVVNGNNTKNPPASHQKPGLYRNDGSGSFTKVADPGLSLINTASCANSCAVSDYDNDGRLDVFITNRRPSNGAGAAQVNLLYRNTSAAGNWIEIRCLGTASNRSAIGARLELRATIQGGSRWQCREISSQTGRFSQNSLVVHFGLGNAEMVEELYIRWPSGQDQHLTGLPVNQRITIQEDGQMVAGPSFGVASYYLYSSGGQLMAEYGPGGECRVEYVYALGRLAGEYHPVEAKTYYHVSDPVRSTRMLFDEEGNVVHSAAYGPYGDPLHTWNATLDSKLKFSGKERDFATGADCFEARYYSNSLYRFLSTDPVRQPAYALNRPSGWNLYQYCANNPVSKYDPDGGEEIQVNKPGGNRRQGNRKTGYTSNTTESQGKMIGPLVFILGYEGGYLHYVVYSKGDVPCETPQSGLNNHFAGDSDFHLARDRAQEAFFLLQQQQITEQKEFLKTINQEEEFKQFCQALSPILQVLNAVVTAVLSIIP